MTDPPGLAIVVAKQPGRGQEEQPPAPLPELCIHAVGLVQYRADYGLVGIVIFQPGQRRLLVMFAVPAPATLDAEQIVKFMDQIMAGHDAACEKIPRDPVGFVRHLKPVGLAGMAEHMQE
jgi:hypothetical protein